MARNPNTAPDIDAQLDRLVDTRGYSYDDARRELGVPTPDYAATVPAVEIDNPKDFSLDKWQNLPQTQKDVNKAGAQAMRAALLADKIKSGE